jgi:hypothetical protein
MAGLRDMASGFGNQATLRREREGRAEEKARADEVDRPLQRQFPAKAPA